MKKGPRRRARQFGVFSDDRPVRTPLCETAKPDAAGELSRTVQHVERREIIQGFR
jgi:hypothetical protein